MPHVVCRIETISAYLFELKENPERFRPPRCPSCGKAKLWRHGCFRRKAGRRGAEIELNPVPILRFFCPGCRHSCSTLPSCLSPRRWYQWVVQQKLLLHLLTGVHFQSAAKNAGVCRQTASRWLHDLHDRHLEFSNELRTHYPDLGRETDRSGFWQRCMQKVGLAEAMSLLLLRSVSVP